MESVQQEKYLGDILTNDGKNSKNRAARKNRGIGVVNQIMTILEEICFGKYYFQAAMILRNSPFMQRPGITFTLTDVTELERVDEDHLLRKVLECSIYTPKEILSTWSLMFGSRRLNFL